MTKHNAFAPRKDDIVRSEKEALEDLAEYASFTSRTFANSIEVSIREDGFLFNSPISVPGFDDPMPPLLLYDSFEQLPKDIERSEQGQIITDGIVNHIEGAFTQKGYLVPNQPLMIFMLNFLSQMKDIPRVNNFLEDFTSTSRFFISDSFQTGNPEKNRLILHHYGLCSSRGRVERICEVDESFAHEKMYKRIVEKGLKKYYIEATNTYTHKLEELSKNLGFEEWKITCPWDYKSKTYSPLGISIFNPGKEARNKKFKTNIAFNWANYNHKPNFYAFFKVKAMGANKLDK